MADELPVVPSRTETASVEVGHGDVVALAGEIYELRKIIAQNSCERSKLCKFPSSKPEEHAPLCPAKFAMDTAHRKARQGLGR